MVVYLVYQVGPDKDGYDPKGLPLYVVESVDIFKRSLGLSHSRMPHTVFDCPTKSAEHFGVELWLQSTGNILRYTLVPYSIVDRIDHL